VDAPAGSGRNSATKANTDARPQIAASDPVPSAPSAAERMKATAGRTTSLPAAMNQQNGPKEGNRHDQPA